MASHIVFDSSYVGDTWDWFKSILIVIDQELWYDPTLGHSHLKEFFYRVCNHFAWYIVLGHTFLGRGLIFLNDHYVGVYFYQSMMDFESWSSLGGDQMSFFTLEHETWLVYFIWYTLLRGIPLSVDDGFWGIDVPWRWLDSFHIGVWDMTEWFP